MNMLVNELQDAGVTKETMKATLETIPFVNHNNQESGDARGFQMGNSKSD